MRASVARAKAPIVIAERLFASKSAAAALVREILYRYPFGATLSAADNDFISALLLRHPEAARKIGPGVAAISVENNGSTRGFWVHRLDGSCTDFSFLACLTPPTHRAQLYAALRHAIRPSIRRFRADAPRPLVCAVSGALLQEGAVHVDHAAPHTFLAIASAFIAEGGGAETIEVATRVDGVVDKELADAGVRGRWIDFHNTRAHLRIVSPTVNLSTLRRRPIATAQ